MSINVANLVMLATVLGAFWRLSGKLEVYRVEHEIVIADYCQRNGIKLRDLPTRSKFRV